MATSSESTVLPEGFTPGEKDVIVGRGKVCYKHKGNQRLNRIVQGVLPTYSAQEATKKSKSELIKIIMIQVRESSPDGGFVKFDSEVGKWFEVGDRIAREKVSQTFRDALNDKYKSSTTSKTLKRRQERINRQPSVGSKDSGTSSSSVAATAAGSSTPASAPPPQTSGNEIPEAQARVDSLLLAATAGAHKCMLVPGMTPSMTSLAHSRLGGGGVNPYLRRPNSLLTGYPSGLVGPACMAHMAPSFANLMAGTPITCQADYSALLMNREAAAARAAAAGALAAHQNDYNALLMNRELEQQALRRSILGSVRSASTGNKKPKLEP